MKIYTVPARAICGEIQANLPGSKSLTNRALIMSALCDEDVLLEGALESEDTVYASQALEKLGVTIERTGTNWLVRGKIAQNGTGDPVQLFLGNSGTSVRFLASVLCARGVPCVIDGTERMRERPAGLLINALTGLGGEITSELGNECPPLKIGNAGLEGGKVSISGRVSSQYFSGLMMAAPLARTPVTLEVADEFVSLPYIQMTETLLEDFGVECQLTATSIEIPAPQRVQSPGTYLIEPDASAASYPLVLGMLHGVAVTIRGLDENSLQGDVKLVEYLVRMGATIENRDGSMRLESLENRSPLGEVDLKEIPDAAMTLVTLAAVTPGHHRFTGLANLAFKECNRLTALETELNKMGANVVADEDGFTIEGIRPEDLRPARIATYNDHRMAMCLALLGTLCAGTQIEDPHCVEKTYPEFWEHLEDWMESASAPVSLSE